MVEEIWWLSLSKRTIQVRLIRSSKENTKKVSKLINFLEKEKLHPEDKEKLKALLENSDEEEYIMNIASDSDEDYNPCLAGYYQDPNEF